MLALAEEQNETSLDLKHFNSHEVSSYIKENKHLPEIPSADEVVKNGIDLGEMNALLLKKIEELTLYLLQQDKEIKELRKMVSFNYQLYETIGVNSPFSCTTLCVQKGK